MLFLFGTRSTTLTTVPLPGVTCAHCQTPDQLLAVVVARYAHLFWIPVFSLGKSSATVCQHCRQALNLREMPAPYRPPVLAVQQQARVPLTHWALLLLFGAVVAISWLIHLFNPSTPAPTASAAPAETTTEAPPVAGARYRTKVGDDSQEYGLVEVTNVTSDTVYYRMTGALRSPLTPASATQALRDSVPPMNSHQHMPLTQWHYSTTGQGMLRKLD